MERHRLHHIVFFIAGTLAFLVWPSAIVFANDVENLKHGMVKITAHVIEGDPKPTIQFFQAIPSWILFLVVPRLCPVLSLL